MTALFWLSLLACTPEPAFVPCEVDAEATTLDDARFGLTPQDVLDQFADFAAEGGWPDATPVRVEAQLVQTGDPQFVPAVDCHPEAEIAMDAELRLSTDDGAFDEHTLVGHVRIVEANDRATPADVIWFTGLSDLEVSGSFDPEAVTYDEGEGEPHSLEVHLSEGWLRLYVNGSGEQEEFAWDGRALVLDAYDGG